MVLQSKHIRVINRSDIVLLIFLVVSITGCKKFLEIPPPKTQTLSSNVFADDATANAAMLGIYSKMANDRGFPYRISLHTGLYADELKNYSTTTDILTFYTNNLNSRNGYLSGDFWTPAYSFIYSANTILEGVNSSANLSEAVGNQLTGEAKFVRAFWHFYLLNLYGDIPLVTTTDYTDNATLARTSSAEVFKKIISDLKDAEAALNENYVGANGFATTVERVRPNKLTASALLSRVYLYTGDWVNAESEASKVINSPLFKLASIDGVFLKNSDETIWSLQPASSGSFSTPEGNNYILTAAPTSGPIRNATISQDLLNSFENSDLRKSKWIGDFSGYLFPNKYKVLSGTSLTEYSVVLRLAEQYLIRAEARAQQSKMADGLQDVNKIRGRAGLADTAAFDKNQLLDIILHERQVELFSEYGHRLFDLKRTGKIDQVMSIVSPQKGGSWASYKMLFPIPQTELDNDPNLSQNTGY